MIERILSWDNLCAAWNDVAGANAAPGADGVSVARWSRNWEERLRALRQAVLTNTYRPQAIAYYAISKPAGGVRRIGQLTVTDKVLQRAALRVLDRVFDPLFLPCSHGYRRGRSVAGAVEAICLWRDAGYRWVLDADIDACFDSLDHAVILRLVQERVPDAQVLRLLQAWLRQAEFGAPDGRGIALGAVISPLLCNITLHHLDLALVRAGHHVVRYADDFVVLCASEAEAHAARDCAGKALETLRLEFEPSKTAITHFDTGFDFLGARFERDAYRYLWRDKRITVEGDFPDWLLAYGPGYE